MIEGACARSHRQPNQRDEYKVESNSIHTVDVKVDKQKC